MEHRFWKLLCCMIAAQASAALVVLVVLQLPWRTGHRHDPMHSFAQSLQSTLQDTQNLRVNPAARRALMHATGTDAIVYAAIVDARGDVLLESGATPIAHDALRALARHRPNHGSSLRIGLLPSRNQQIIRAPLAEEFETGSELILVAEELAAQRSVQDGFVAIVCGVFLALIVPFPFACRRFRQWTRGLHDVHAGVRCLALDKPLKPVVIKGDSEAAYLAIAFNDMASRLIAGKNELIDTNRRLEMRVAERTEELHIANEKLEKQNCKLEELTETALRFTDDVAHDFRTPLAVVMEFASIMSDGIGGTVTEEHEQFLRHIIHATSDLSRLVDDYLDSSKLRARTLRVDRRPHTVDEILDAIWPTLQSRAECRGITLARDVPPGIPRVFVDAQMIDRAIMNLAANAIKFSPEGCAVLLGASSDSGMVTISVKDQGPGMSEAECEQLFARFRQGSEGRRPDMKGFGLGLSIAQEMVRINLGSITVSSRPRQGSTFSFTLPSDRTETIVAMFMDRVLERADQRPIGFFRVRPTSPEISLDSIMDWLAATLYTEDVQIRGQDEDEVLLLGATTNAARWRDRLYAEAASYRSGAGHPFAGTLEFSDPITLDHDRVLEAVVARIGTRSPS